MESHFFQSCLLPQKLSDASGAFGCGAFSLSQGWFQIIWPQHWQSIHITAKELLPIVVAAAVWGHTWQRQRICFRTDNMAVVELLKSRTSRDSSLMHLLRCLHFYAAFFRFNFECRHLPGNLNTAADAISCNSIPLFILLSHRSLTLLSPRPSSTCW